MALNTLLTIVGARADGTKELLAMEIGYRESKASWGTLSATYAIGD